MSISVDQQAPVEMGPRPMPEGQILPAPQEIAQQVTDEVRAKGDALDKQPWMRRLSFTGNVAMLGSGVVGSWMGGGEMPGPITYGLAVVAGSAGVGIGERLIRGRSLRHRMDDRLAQNENLGDAYGVKVEVFRQRRVASTKKQPMKKGTLDLRWYSQQEKLSTPDLANQLEGVLQAAQDGDIEHVTVPLCDVESFIDQPVASRAQSHNEWFHERTKLKFKDKVLGDKQVITLSRSELREVVNRVFEELPASPLEGVVGILRQLNDAHPAVRAYDQNTPNRDQRLAKTFGAAIARRNQDVEAVALQEDGMRIPGKEKLHLHSNVSYQRGRVKARFHSLPDMRRAHTEDILLSRGLTPELLAKRLENWEHQPPEQTIELCEIAGLLALSDPDFVLPSGAIASSHGGRQRNVSPLETKERGSQERVRDRLFKRGLWGKERDIKIASDARLTVGYIAIFVATLPGIFVGIRAQDEVEQAMVDRTGQDAGWDEAREALLRDDPIMGSVSKYLNFGDNLIYKVESRVAPLEEHLHLRVNSLPEDPPEDMGYTAGNTLLDPDDPFTNHISGVGNVAGRENRPAYYLTPIAGAETAGYWAQSRSVWLQGGGVVALGWGGAGDLAEGNQLHELTPPDELNGLAPMIKVEVNVPRERLGVDTFTMNDDGIYCALGSEDENCEYWTRMEALTDVPVLLGHRIVAAEVEDASGAFSDFYTYQGDDGFHRLALPTETYGKLDGHEVRLTYWTQPDPTIELPHATNLLVGPQNTVSFDPESFIGEDYRATATQAWEDYLGYRLPTDPEERLAFMKAKIRQFTYEIAPFERGDEINPVAAFMDTALNEEEANCNVAATLLLLNNPELLNYVTGFRNSNTEEQTANGQEYLSIGESHAWAVGAEGDVHDATPSDRDGDDAGFFEENFGDRSIDEPDQTEKHLIELGFVLTGLILAGGAWRKRNNVRQRLGEHSLRELAGSLTDDDLLVLSKVVDFALYAPEGAIFNHNASTTTTPAEVWERLVSYGEQDRTRYRKTMSALRAERHPEELHAGLQIAQQAIRAARHAAAGVQQVGS